MNEHEELSDFQKEWRAIVLTKLDKLTEGQVRLASDVVDIKTSFVQRDQYEKKIDSLEKKISELESFKARLIGIVIGLQFVGGLVFWYILKILKV